MGGGDEKEIWGCRLRLEEVRIVDTEWMSDGEALIKL